MSSWYSSWFSGFPTFDFAVPATIQRRFFSFILKKTLGGFLRPGQFDLHQIDSQLGSGAVHVTDLELDEQAINELLVGLPFRLHDGFIAGVTARVPFPNPLTSSVGLHVRSLQLTLHVVTDQYQSPSTSPLFSTTGLADSVTSVAETFVHRELTPKEEAAFLESLHPTPALQHQADDSEHLPGGFDPFIRNHDVDTEGRTLAIPTDSDPAGVSVFATFIERLLARFELSALDTKVTIVHPGHSSFTFTIQEIHYHTHGGVGPHPQHAQPPPVADECEHVDHRAQVRSVVISGFSVTSRNLRPLVNSPANTTSTLSPVSSSLHSPTTDRGPFTSTLSRSSSSSSLDEDTQMLMSQSIAMLPPRPLSPASSVSSSIYQSVLSMDEHVMGRNVPSSSHTTAVPITVDHERRTPFSPRGSTHHSTTVAQESNSDVILSFGPKPITVQLYIPPPGSRRTEQPHQVDKDRPEGTTSPETEVLQLSVTTGTLACALRACHVRMLLDLMDSCRPRTQWHPPVSDQRSSHSPHFALGLRANVNIRGVVLALISEPRGEQSLSLSSFFEHPFIPPRLCCPYVRLLLDDITGSCYFVPPSTDKSALTSAETVLSDISLLVFHAVSAAEDLQVATPIMITDWYLPTLDSTGHFRPSFTSENPSLIQLPIFDAIDWTQPKFKANSTRLWTWRTKPRNKTEKLRSPAQRARALSSSPNPFIASPPTHETEKLLPPAIKANVAFSLETPSLHVKVAPLHFFLDPGMFLDGNVLLRFIDEVTSSSSFVSKSRKREGNPIPRDPADFKGSVGEPEGHARCRSISAQARESEIERRRLERLVLDDLNLGLEYDIKLKGFTNSTESARHQAPFRKQKAADESNLDISLSCSVIRVEVRCTPPPGRLPRSGSLLVNIHDFLASNNPAPKKSPLRFSEGLRTAPQPAIDHPSRVEMCAVQLLGIIVAYAPATEIQAQTLCVLGCMPDTTGDAHASALFVTEPSGPLPIRLALGKTNLPISRGCTPSTRFSLTVDIPLINLVIEKSIFDGLQYWTDDIAQLFERCMSCADNVTEALPSRNPSLIGSRFFMKPGNSGSRSSEDSTFESPVHKPQVASGETVVKINVTEALFRILLRRDEHDPGSTRPFDIQASDIDALIELKPDGKDETVITAGIMDLRVADTSRTGVYTPLVVLAAPRSLSAAPKPMVKTRLTSLVVPETTIKESKVKLSLCGITCHVPPDLHFVTDLTGFAKAPPGVFESVVPSERTVLSVAVVDVSVQLEAPEYPGSAVLHLGEADFSTELIGNSPELGFKINISSLHFLIIDSIHGFSEVKPDQKRAGLGATLWKNSGYALVADVENCHLSFRNDNSVLPPETSIIINGIELGIHLCADTLSALTSFINHLVPKSQDNEIEEPFNSEKRISSALSVENDQRMIGSLDEDAFKRVPEVGSTADMIGDDLPANLDYLDASFGTAAGLRELRDDDLEDFDAEEESGRTTPVPGETGVVSNVGGETIRIFKGFSFTEHYFDTITPDVAGRTTDGETTLRVRVHDADVTLFLHDGYDWPRTRKIIEQEIKEMRKRLARIRQLVATGQTQETVDEETSTMLFNSIHIGLEQDLENMDADTLIAAIDHELDEVAETSSQSSWQSLHPASPGLPRIPPTRVHGRRLTRSKGPSIEIRLSGLHAEVDNYRPGETLVSRTLILVKDLEILDHIKTSTWKKFLTALWTDSRGNIRETDSNMARVELLTVRPSLSHSAEEARLRAKLLPLRLYVDQDALDFFKKFFAFKDPDSPAASNDADNKGDVYFQHAEVFPVDIKLDYKPRRVDYRALREGRTIELMNFFHFDGAEMTLRHLTLHGITGWPRFFDTLNDLWTPDVKATQLVDVISGVAPIRSVVNVGSGVADLVLLPIAQYKKDGRIVRGVQKGTKAFVQSTAMEAIKLGARLATGTQVILEQTENVLGGQFKDPITAETLQTQAEDSFESEEDLISRYAMQPSGVTEGVQTAYRSLRKGIHSAAQTILAVPMEVYERSGNEGAVRAVIRAVPIAVLKPMIGASEAVGKTLMGLHNTLDPNVRHENEAKYKHR